MGGDSVTAPCLAQNARRTRTRSDRSVFRGTSLVDQSCFHHRLWHQDAAIIVPKKRCSKHNLKMSTYSYTYLPLPRGVSLFFEQGIRKPLPRKNSRSTTRQGLPPAFYSKLLCSAPFATALDDQRSPVLSVGHLAAATTVLQDDSSTL